MKDFLTGLLTDFLKDFLTENVGVNDTKKNYQTLRKSAHFGPNVPVRIGSSKKINFQPNTADFYHVW